MFYSTRPDYGLDYMGQDFAFVAPQDHGSNTALDGNDSANRRIIVGKYTPVTPIADGETFYLTWHHTDERGKDHGLAIDDVWIEIVEESTEEDKPLSE